jgi:hypothetical protein
VEADNGALELAEGEHLARAAADAALNGGDDFAIPR